MKFVKQECLGGRVLEISFGDFIFLYQPQDPLRSSEVLQRMWILKVGLKEFECLGSDALRLSEGRSYFELGRGDLVLGIVSFDRGGPLGRFDFGMKSNGVCHGDCQTR